MILKGLDQNRGTARGIDEEGHRSERGFKQKIDGGTQHRNRDREVGGLQRSPGHMVEPGAEIRFTMVRISREGEVVLDQEWIQRQRERKVHCGQS